MGREIKFRTWFKKPHNCMDYNTGVFRGNAVVNDDSCAFNSNIVMQFIGIKDKNKEELYEGDIVMLSSKNNTASIKCAIEYSIQEVGFVFKSVINGLIYPVRIFKSSLILKLGNIYENPELLKDDK